MSKKSVTGPVKAPLGSYPKLLRLLDHYFLKEDIIDRANVEALDTIVDINAAIIANPKSVNLRSIRSSDPSTRNLVEVGGTDILTEIGWRFRVQHHEECWVLPYDADLDQLAQAQEKLLETQQKIRDRFARQVQAVSGRAQKEKAEKLEIIKQIEQDKAEREHRQQLRSGAPPKETQSLDEIRKQAVRERLEREKAKQSQRGPAQPVAELPGSFPQRLAPQHSDPVSQTSDLAESDESEEESMTRPPRVVRTPKKRAPVPIEVNKKPVTEKYVAGVHTLGGPRNDDTQNENEYMDADEFKYDDE